MPELLLLIEEGVYFFFSLFSVYLIAGCGFVDSRSKLVRASVMLASPGFTVCVATILVKVLVRYWRV